MSKIAFTKLNLTKNIAIKILEWQNQKIEVKQYLSVGDKLDLISRVVSNSLDEHVFINPCKIKIFKTIEIILTYTNINVTDKQLEDIFRIYDLFNSSSLEQKIYDLIPKEEINFIETGINDTIHEIYNYKNSFMGVMEQTQNNYQDISKEVEQIENTLSNPQQMALLKDVITKLD